MAQTVGGSIQSVTLAGRIFPVAADVESDRKLGGFENEFMPNGDGSGRIVKTRTGWSLGTIAVEVNDDREDQEFLQELIDSPDFFPVAVTYVTDATYQGQGQITGELNTASKEAKAEITLQGPGKLTKQ